MSHRNFYRTTGTERKRKFRQKSTVIKLDFELNDLQSDSSYDDDCLETDNETQYLANDSLGLSQHSSYPFDCVKFIDTTDVANSDLAGSDDLNNNESDTTEDENNDNNDDDLSELLGTFDSNREQKLYASCSLSIYQACIEFIKLCRDINVNKQQIGRLLSGLRVLLPSDNKLPCTVAGLMKIVSK